MVPEPRDATRRLIGGMSHEASEPLTLERGSEESKGNVNPLEPEERHTGGAKLHALRGVGNAKPDAEQRGPRPGTVQAGSMEPAKESRRGE